MLRLFPISNTKNLIKKFIKLNNNLFTIPNTFSFSAKSHDHKKTDSHNNHEHHQSSHDNGHGHHEDPKEYHDAKFNRVSYNQILNAENRQP